MRKHFLLFRSLLAALAIAMTLLATNSMTTLSLSSVAPKVATLQTTSPLAQPAATDRSAGRQRVTDIDTLGVITFTTGLTFTETEVGGLSGIVYDAANDRYLAISDDRSQRQPARFYTIAIDLSDGTLDEGDVTFEAVTTLLDEAGAPFAENSLDPEGIALTSDGRLFISSEGNANAEPPVNPFVREFSLAGQQLAEFALPEKYLPNAEKTVGIRNNLAFESLTLSPDGLSLYAAVENALNQDGPQSNLEDESLARVLQFDLASGEPVHEFGSTQSHKHRLLLMALPITAWLICCRLITMVLSWRWNGPLPRVRATRSSSLPPKPKARWMCWPLTGW